MLKTIVSLLVVFLVAFQFVTAQQTFAKNLVIPNKNYNKANCILDAAPDNVKWKDTTYYYASKLNSCRYAEIMVTLINITGDTLKYSDMNCSNLDIFATDTKNIHIFQDLRNCFKNNLTLFRLAPYARNTFKVPVYVFIDGAQLGHTLIPKEFKIGMALNKYDSIPPPFLGHGSIAKKDSGDIIWSNAIAAQ